MTVTATAYNSVESQTDGDPTVAAWGDRLTPGMKAVAVSRDLLAEGLTRGTRIRIEGLPGTYVVLDTTARRFTKRIDIYMGIDVEKARQFGVRQVEIRWIPDPDGD
jgi:3D (Asp-Asp-Asp) domain-containing protein